MNVRMGFRSLGALLLTIAVFGAAEMVETCDHTDAPCSATRSRCADENQAPLPHDGGSHHSAHCACACHLTLAPIVTEREHATTPIAFLGADLQLRWPSRSLPRLFRPPIAVSL